MQFWTRPFFKKCIVFPSCNVDQWKVDGQLWHTWIFAFSLETLTHALPLIAQFLLETEQKCPWNQVTPSAVVLKRFTGVLASSAHQYAHSGWMLILVKPSALNGAGGMSSIRHISPWKWKFLSSTLLLQRKKGSSFLVRKLQARWGLIQTARPCAPHGCCQRPPSPSQICTLLPTPLGTAEVRTANAALSNRCPVLTGLCRRGGRAVPGGAGRRQRSAPEQRGHAWSPRAPGCPTAFCQPGPRGNCPPFLLLCHNLQGGLLLRTSRAAV